MDQSKLRKFIKPVRKDILSFSRNSYESTPDKRFTSNIKPFELDTTPIKRVKDMSQEKLLYQKNKLMNNVQSMKRKVESQYNTNQSTKIIDIGNHSSKRRQDSENQSNEVSYLLKCIEERDQTIKNLRQQLSNVSKQSYLQSKQPVFKQQTIHNITKQSPANNELFQTKKQNYKLKLKINDLIHQISSLNQRKEQMESMICDLYFDNQFRVQESQMISNIQGSCGKAREQFLRIMKDDGN